MLQFWMLGTWRWGVGCLLGLATLLSAQSATITGFSPDRGGPGTEVAISGTGLQTASLVYFGATDATGEIVSRSANLVRARVPPNALTGQISIFTTASGTASSLAIFVAAPRIAIFTPQTGPPDTLVTVSGANFGTGSAGARGNITSVLFNQQSAAFQIVGINQLLALVPPNATSGPLTVVNEAGSFTTLVPFDVAAGLSGFTPPRGMPGDAIEIRGRNLGSTIRVEFGLEPARFSVLSTTNLLAWVPTNAVNNRLQLTTPAGTVATPSNFVVLPRIISFSPVSGPIGTVVRLQGGGFQGLTEVQFNGIRATTGTFVSSTVVDVAVPSGATTGPIRLVTTNGTFTTTESFHLPAVFSTFNPNSGARGTNVTLQGANLLGTTSVRFNGVPAEFTVLSGTQVRAIVPPAATTGRIAIETPAGEVQSSGTFTVRPVLDGFTPASAPVGAPVALLGAGLTNLAWVRFADVDASFTVLSSTNVRAIVPLGAYSGPIRLRTLAGLETEASGVFFVDGARPVLNSFTPTTGIPGVTVLLTGQGLRSTSRVQFNGTDAAFVVRSGTQVDATVPPSATSGTIAVTTLDGIAFSAAPFVVTPPSFALSIESDGIQIVLRWSSAATGFVLESSVALGPDAIWQPVSATPVQEGSTFRVTLPLPTAGANYYRLRN